MRGMWWREGFGVVGAGGGWSFAGWFGGDASAKREVEVGEGGVYVYGGLGSGKMFVMDLFYVMLDGEYGVEKCWEYFYLFMFETYT